jgi:hypothetical protein
MDYRRSSSKDDDDWTPLLFQRQAYGFISFKSYAEKEASVSNSLLGVSSKHSVVDLSLSAVFITLKSLMH